MLTSPVMSPLSKGKKFLLLSEASEDLTTAPSLGVITETPKTQSIQISNENQKALQLFRGCRAAMQIWSKLASYFLPSSSTDNFRLLKSSPSDAC